MKLFTLRLYFICRSSNYFLFLAELGIFFKASFSLISKMAFLSIFLFSKAFSNHFYILVKFYNPFNMPLSYAVEKVLEVSTFFNY